MSEWLGWLVELEIGNMDAYLRGREDRGGRGSGTIGEGGVRLIF